MNKYFFFFLVAGGSTNACSTDESGLAFTNGADEAVDAEVVGVLPRKGQTPASINFSGEESRVECMPGQEDCLGNVPRSCDSAGTWQSGQACMFACSMGVCSGDCRPGDKRCGGKGVQICDDSFSWKADRDCKEACVEGTCVDDECITGTSRCATGNKIEECEHGKWSKAKPCKAQLLCAAGLCA